MYEVKYAGNVSRETLALLENGFQPCLVVLVGEMIIMMFFQDFKYKDVTWV